jgi:hypothetical protein
MGGQGALRFSYKYPHLFPVVAAISPVIDYHVRFGEVGDTIATMYPDQEAARRDTVPFHIDPSRAPQHQFFCCDPADSRWWSGADRLHGTLVDSGITHDCDLMTTAGGHGFPYYTHMAGRAISFLMEGLGFEHARFGDPQEPRTRHVIIAK